MTNAEVFPNPTVQEVHFEIRFPNLFFLEQRIGDFQLRIIDKFPKSQELLTKQIVIAQLDAEGEPPTPGGPPGIQKIWQFSSDEGLTLDVRTGHLGLMSTQHKTYDNQKHDTRFRDLISDVVGEFLTVVEVPTLTRVGLRYVDHIPISAQTNDAVLTHCNTVLPYSRFPFEDAIEMSFSGGVKRGAACFRYSEKFDAKRSPFVLVLDFDGYKTDVPSHDCLATTDELHALIAKEFDAAATPALKEHMRQQPCSPEGDTDA